MNDFQLYHYLCNLRAQIEPYAQTQELFLELKKAAEQYSSKTYRVAVIGEFKRGKSSLINALLGTEILPTDILPTTAVINRITYSVDQKIVIHFKNGETQESTISSLADYATKLDQEKEQFAETIREISVQYPFVLGQNHIELIDTPGLNDNESMTETTLNILGEIDTAIVVISAMIPVSKTEQNLICDLIRQADIYNLVFAVTFIDRVSDEEDEQDRVVELIKNRLAEDTLQHFCDCVADPNLAEKAKRILSQPNVYAVSSRQAIQGFIKGRNDLIEKSRFKQFKYNLSALLTANQEKDHLLKVKRICSELEEQFPQWSEQHFQNMDEHIQAMQGQCAQLQNLYGSSQAYLNGILLQLEEAANKKKDETISNVTYETEFKKYLARFFIAQLSSIKRSEFCEEALRDALQQACMQANLSIQTVATILTETFNKLANDAFEEINLHYASVLNQLNEKPETASQPESQQLSAFVLSAEEILGAMSSLEDACMPYVLKAIQAGLDRFDNSIEGYWASYRIRLIGHHKQIKTILGNAAAELTAEIADIQKRLQHERGVAENGQAQIADTLLTIKSIIN